MGFQETTEIASIGTQKEKGQQRPSGISSQLVPATSLRDSPWSCKMSCNVCNDLSAATRNKDATRGIATRSKDATRGSWHRY